MSSDESNVENFVENWVEDANLCRKAFLEIKNHLSSKDGILLDFNARPGISHSLRAAHARGNRRPLFVMVDVIEDDPRWLSVCFYRDMVSDPEMSGDLVRGGLLGEDGICFDLDRWDPEYVDYMKRRIDEAWRHGSAEK